MSGPFLYLRNVRNRPDAGWKVIQPETGSLVEGRNWPDLLVRVKAYRMANNLPLEPNFERQVHGQVCLTLSPGERARRCKFEGCGGAIPRHLRPWRTTAGTLKNWAVAAFEVVTRWSTGDSSLLVGAQVARERARVCAMCPENLPVASCFGCGVLGKAMRSLRGRAEIAETLPPTETLPTTLETCDVCGCSNALQVHFDQGLLDEIRRSQGLPENPYPNWCWKNTNSTTTPANSENPENPENPED